jgi:hypothetical protein
MRILIGTPLLLAVLTAQEADRAARVPIEKWIRAHTTGERQPVLDAFLPTARFQGIRPNGMFEDISLEQYAASFRGTPEDVPRARTIEFIETRGPVGAARVTVQDPKFAITYYFLLMRRDGEWRIGQCTFTVSNAARQG